jgi:hypothetical protein
MNAFQIVQLYKAGKTAYKAGKEGKKLYEKLLHGGKDRVGKVLIRDNRYHLWEVKVRETGKRGRYLKITSELNGDEILASADNYKIGKYLSITSDEWEVFALYTEHEEDENLDTCAKNILNRLVR